MTFHHFQLVLEASDRGVPSLTSRAELIVTLRDMDDNPPIFSVRTHQPMSSLHVNYLPNYQEPPHYIISEAQPILTPFAILQTEDLDTEQNSDAFYYITGILGVQVMNNS